MEGSHVKAAGPALMGRLARSCRADPGYGDVASGGDVFRSYWRQPERVLEQRVDQLRPRQLLTHNAFGFAAESVARTLHLCNVNHPDPTLHLG